MEFDIFEEARVEAPNPYSGMVLWNKPDFFPKGFTEQELDNTYYGLVRDPDDYALMMESAPFEEVDAYYNPGTEEVDAAFITEAVVVKKFSRLEGVVRRGIVKAMNKYMTATDPDTGTPITAMDPIVGKPRKSGLFAYVTVQIPFSDGQVVSIVFHAPEGDQKKISPDDTVVAFRWLLNKRDITNAVAPEDGKEISLETVSKRVGQLVEKNTKRFAATQKEAQAEKKELADAQESIKGLQGQTDSLMVQIADSSKELETISAQIGTTAAALEKQKTINAELRAKLEALRKAQAGNTTGTGSAGTTGTGSDTDTSTTVKLPTKPFGPAYNRKTAVRLDSILSDFHISSDEAKYFSSTLRLSGSDKVLKKDFEAELNRLRNTRANGEDLYSLNDLLDMYNLDKMENYKKFSKTSLAKSYASFTKSQFALMAQEAGVQLPGISPDSGSNTETSSGEPVFVQDLNDILAGKYDNNTDPILDMLERALDEAEKPENEQYMDLVNKASDYYTEILSKEAA